MVGLNLWLLKARPLNLCIRPWWRAFSPRCVSHFIFAPIFKQNNNGPIKNNQDFTLIKFFLIILHYTVRQWHGQENVAYIFLSRIKIKNMMSSKNKSLEAYIARRGFVYIVIYSCKWKTGKVMHVWVYVVVFSANLTNRISWWFYICCIYFVLGDAPKVSRTFQLHSQGKYGYDSGVLPAVCCK